MATKKRRDACGARRAGLFGAFGTALAIAAAIGPVSGACAGERAIGWLQATPFAGSIGVVWRSGDGLWLGIEGGGGVPEIDRTLAPEDRGFLRIIHLGGVARLQRSGRFHLELGPQIGIGELDNDPNSGDDMPNLFGGLAVTAMYGGRHWRVGPRLDLVGLFDEPPDRWIFVANATPVAVRVEW